MLNAIDSDIYEKAKLTYNNDRLLCLACIINFPNY